MNLKSEQLVYSCKRIFSTICSTSTSDLSTAADITPVLPSQPSRHSTIAEEEFDPLAADWRRAAQQRRNRRRCGVDTGVRSRRPPRPGTASDMWSFGCLMHEVLTGSKLFVGADRLLARALRPAQLSEMRSGGPGGSAEAAYASRGLSGAWAEARDLVRRCLEESPSSRPTAHWALSQHPFLTRDDLRPEHGDLASLPTCALMLMDVLGKRRRKRTRQGQEAEEDEEGAGGDLLLSEIRRSASAFGAVSSVSASGDHVLVEFCDDEASRRAREGLTEQQREWDVVFCPVGHRQGSL